MSEKYAFFVDNCIWDKALRYNNDIIYPRSYELVWITVKYRFDVAKLT